MESAKIAASLKAIVVGARVWLKMTSLAGLVWKKLKCMSYLRVKSSLTGCVVDQYTLEGVPLHIDDYLNGSIS